jgi:N-methylhydantoinase A
VTDAMVVCGWLGHTSMAYGQLSLDIARARAVVGDLAAKLDRTAEETAQAILDIAISEMFVEVEKLASRSGVDLRDFTLMPFGGGGPMFGAFLARELGMHRVIAPRRPGVVSALGGLVADLRGDFIRTVFTSLAPAALPALRETCEALSREGLAWLAVQGHTSASELKFSADMRYSGQSFEIEVLIESDWIMRDDLAAIVQAFHETHARIYDFHDPKGLIELVNLRLSAIGAGPRLTIPEAEAKPAPAKPYRMLPVFTGHKTEIIPLYRREDLQPGAQFSGPAVVVQEDTTFAIPAGAEVQVDRHFNLLLNFVE